MRTRSELEVRGTGLPWRSGRTFRVWRYGVGHSQLLLRSPAEGGSEALGILFEAVEFMVLRRTYPDLVLRPANEDEDVQDNRDDIGSLSGSRLSMALEGRSHTGLVRCSKVTVRRIEDPEDDSWTAGKHLLSVTRR